MFTFYHHDNNARIKDINQVSDRVINILCKCSHSEKSHQGRDLGVLGDEYLMVIDGKVKKIFLERNILRVGLLQLLCLENLFTQKAKVKDLKVETIVGKQLESTDLMKSFQDKIWFIQMGYY